MQPLRPAEGLPDPGPERTAPAPAAVRASLRRAGLGGRGVGDGGPRLTPRPVSGPGDRPRLPALSASSPGQGQGQ